MITQTKSQLFPDPCMVFKDRGGQGDLSKVIFGFGNDFVDELRAGDKDLKVDLVNSYAVVRA